MTAPLSVPSVYTIMIALEEIEGAIRHQPSPEDNAAGKDLGMPVLHLGGKGFDRVGRLIPSDADEAAATSERPVVIFEVRPKVTDAEVFEALGEDSGEVARQLPIKGTDALGWYVTFHQRAAQHGIYLPIEGVAELALGALGGLELTPERRLEIAFHSILRHELFHFEADCMAANWELATRAAVYWWAADEFRETPGYKDLEEALANAYMLRGLRHPSAVLRDSQGSYDAVKAFCALQPLGYRDGPRYAKSRRGYAEGCRALSANFADATPDNIGLAVHALDTLMFYPDVFQVNWRRCPILVHDSLGVLEGLGIGIDFFERIERIVETPSFRRSLSKLHVGAIWNRTKGKAARNLGLNSLGFQKWPAGGADCYSINVDSNFRAHLHHDRSTSLWTAVSIGDHKSMGHG